MNKLSLLFQNPQKFFRLLRERISVKGRIVPIKHPAYRSRFQMSLADWVIRHQNEVLTKQVTWMGVPVWKNALDLHIYQEIIYEQRPNFIVEIGSAHGGSALYFAHLCDLLNNGKVISIDVDHRDFQPEHDRVIKMTGMSNDAGIVKKVHELVGSGTCLVIQDADHSEAGVLQDLRAYSDLVPVGGYFIVEDTIADVFNPGNGVGRLMDGPLCAVEKFLQENRNFTVDESRERYLLTQNPGGFLKRIRRG